jgi:aminoglycoside phosphotransferase (APT) family kinase protein
MDEESSSSQDVTRLLPTSATTVDRMDARPPDDVTTVRDLLAQHLPDLLVGTVGFRGEGLENIAYDVNSEFILRISKEPDPARRAALVAREAELLAIIAPFSPLPIPAPIVIAESALLYRTLAGRPLLDLPAAFRAHHASGVAAALGSFLLDLQAIPTNAVAGCVQTDDDPMTLWLSDAVESYQAATAIVPDEHRSRIEAFLAAAPPQPAPGLVFSHNDLGIEHVLVDPDTAAVTGVLDWTDAALVDPAYDFGLLQRDLGPAALDAALASYPPDQRDALLERAGFYARCSVLEDLAWGDEAGREPYVRKGLDALRWLFA